MARPDKDREQEQQDTPKSRRSQRRAAVRASERAARAARHAEPEDWNRRLIIGSIVAAIIVAFGFIGFGWYQTQIKPLGKTVLRVNETTISLGHLERRMELERERNFIFSGTNQNLLQLPELVIDQLEAGIVLLDGLSELGLSVTDEDVAAEVRSRGGLADEVEASIYADELRQQVEDSGLKAGEYELLLRTEIAQDKAQAYFVYVGPQSEEQARGQVMALRDRVQADEVLQRLESGEDFLAVGEELALNPENLEIDWTPRGGTSTIIEDVEEFLFSAEEGELSEVFELGETFYVAQLLERDPDRELGEDQRTAVGSRELDTWVRDLRESYNEQGLVERNFDEDDAIRALDDIL
ncbi:MAG: SurA N-terminal domain-containing protein [Dehalococcoidia bacterium]